MFAALRRMVDPKARLRHALGQMELPSFPAIHLEVLRSLRSPETPLTHIGRELTADPGISVKVLRTVNSAAFGLGRKVSDPVHASALLGRSELENLVLGLAVQSALPHTPIGGFSPERFWRAASRRAATARLLADRVSPRERSLCFTAGLLQDMAVPLLAAARPDAYRELLRKTDAGPDLASAELAELGFDHTDVAGWLCDEWQFPTPLGSAIVAHHSTSDDAPVAVQVVALIHEGLEDPEPMVEAARDRLGLATDTVVDLFHEGLARGDAMAHQMLS